MIYIVNIQVYEEDLNVYTCVSLLKLLLALTPSRNFLLGDLIRENSYRHILKALDVLFHMEPPNI